MSEANQITAELLIRIPEQFPQIRVWRANRIKALAVGRGGKLRMVNAGIDGQADLTGIARLHLPDGTIVGVRIEVEIKAGKDRLSEDQKNFRNMILNNGGVYIEARSVEACLAELARAMKAGEGV